MFLLALRISKTFEHSRVVHDVVKIDNPSSTLVRYPHGLEVMSPSAASKKANVVQFAAAADGGSAAVAAKAKARAQFSDDGTNSSAAIAEDRSVKSHYVLNSVIDVALNHLEEEGEGEGQSADSKAARPASKTSGRSRMETYKAEWAAGAEGAAAERPLLPEDVERWREEKARRMVAWINNSQLTGYWGSETPWWKVMLRAVEAAEDVEVEEGEKGHKASSKLQGHRDHAADEENAAMLSFFDSLNIVEHSGDGEGAKDAPDSGVVAAKAKGYR